MTETNTRADKASTTLATMLDYLGLDAVVKAEEKNGKITLITYSEDAGRIIGKKGQSLQCLELLLNRMVLREDVESPWISIDVDGYSSKSRTGSRDGGGYKRREYKGDRETRSNDRYSGDRNKGYDRDRNRADNRDDNRDDRRGNGLEEEQLQQMALDAAKEVKRWGDALTLKAMNSHERRIVHMTLREDTEIETVSKSVGDNDKLKKVVISLKDGKK